MSDGGETTITGGGSTAGLRQAAMAKGATKGDPTRAPVRQPKPTPSADAVADSDARAQHRKLPTRERAEREVPVEEGDADLAALAEAIEGDDGGAVAEETIRIGEHEIPVSVLEQLPDEALKRIKRKLKAGGRELEVTLAEALEAVPRAEGWQRKMWEASQRAKQVDSIAQRFLADPIGAAEQLAELYGIGRGEARQRLEQAMLERYKYEGLDPEERAKLDRQRELEAKARRADELEREAKEREAQAETARHREVFTRAMSPAIEAAGLRATPHTIARVAMTLDAAMRDGIIASVPTEGDFRWAAGEVAKERAAERDAELPEDADGDTLIERIGEKRASIIARAWAKRVAKQAPSPTRSGAPPRAKPAQTREKPRSFAEWQRQANARARARDKAAGRR